MSEQEKKAVKDRLFVDPHGGFVRLSCGLPSKSMRERLVNYPTKVVLRLYPETKLTRKYGKKINAMGGRYERLNGDSAERWVHLPLTQEGIELANVLLAEYPLPEKSGRKKLPTAVSFGGIRGMPYRWQYFRTNAETVEEALTHYDRHFEGLLAKGEMEEVTEADLVADEEMRERVRRHHEFKEVSRMFKIALAKAESVGLTVTPEQREVVEGIAFSLDDLARGGAA